MSAYSERKVEGVVVRKGSKDIRVDTPDGTLLCSLRGRFRRGERGRSPVVVGDRVLVSVLSETEGVLESILPRRSELMRGTAGGRPNVVAANVDRLLVVLAARSPPPRWSLVDRMLVAAERDSLEPAICLNKKDQVAAGSQDARSLESALEVYRGLGYVSFSISALRGTGLEPLESWLKDEVTVFSGHSGVGKSTLLNCLIPGLEVGTGRVNAVTGKGRHTTAAVSLFGLPSGGYVADTPGFREFFPVGLKRAELGRHYPEFRRVQVSCRYSDCLHRVEPSCAVRDGVESGEISRLRYDNYLQILSTLVEV